MLPDKRTQTTFRSPLPATLFKLPQLRATPLLQTTKRPSSSHKAPLNAEITCLKYRRPQTWPVRAAKPYSYNLLHNAKPKLRKNQTAQKEFIGRGWYGNCLVDEKHLRILIVQRQLGSNDIETNPGPPTQPETKLSLLTQNCRGLSDERKLKHLLNNSYKIAKTSPNFIIALQETMITSDQRLRFGWRGTHIFTPGTGHGRGCVTLLPTHVQPDSNTVTHFGQRGHVFKATMNENSVVIANIYSPNGHNRDKVDFTERIKRAIEALRDPNDDVYLMGDLNTVFATYETHCRTYSNQEQRCATQIKHIIDSLALEDIWTNNRTAHTWRQTGTKKALAWTESTSVTTGLRKMALQLTGRSRTRIMER